MLRARKDAKKLSENDVNINTTLRSFSVKFMRFKDAIGFLQSPCCKERHEASSKIISEDIASVRQHLADCRAFTADNEALAELLSQHITYVKELITKASRLLGEEQLCPTEEKIALRFGRLWEKGDHRRVYFDEKVVAEAVGFEIRSVRGSKRYFLEEDEYTNSAMAKIFQAFDSTYYDLTKKAFVSASSKNTLLDLFKAVFDREVEAEKSDNSEPNPGQPEELEKEHHIQSELERIFTKEKYDPEHHIRVHEVREIFRRLIPHAPNSTRLLVHDIDPRERGETFRIGLSYLGEDMLAFPCRLSHPSSTMAFSRYVISDKLWGGWAKRYEVVFDRDLVNALVKTWKESDPVVDSRAEEAARKERARARREAQEV